MHYRGFHLTLDCDGYVAVRGTVRLKALTFAGIHRAVDCHLDGPDHDGGRAFAVAAQA